MRKLTIINYAFKKLKQIKFIKSQLIKFTENNYPVRFSSLNYLEFYLK